MPGGGGGGNQVTTSVTQLPPWVDTAAVQNWQLAEKTAAGLKKPFTGNLVPGFTSDQNAAFAATRAAAGQAQPGIRDAMGVMRGAANYQPTNVQASTVAGGSYNPTQVGGGPQAAAQTIGSRDVTAGSFLTGNIQRYLNPQTTNIENRALDSLDRSRRQSLGQIGGQAASMGAFGGSRQGILEGVTNAESARAAGDLSARLRGEAFDRGAALMTADQNRALDAARANQGAALTASQANQGANLQAQGMNLNQWLQGALANQAASSRASEFGLSQGLQAGLANQAAGLEAARANQAAGLTANQQRMLSGSQLGALAQQGQEAALQGASALQATGNQQQQHAAAKLAQDAANYEALRNFPLEQLNIRMSALGMTPYGQATTQVAPKTTQAGNPFLSALGGAGAGANIASALKLSGGQAMIPTLLMAGMGAFGGSDERLKTDKQRVGTDPQTGVPLYAYRYKGDPKSYPKVVGPMAQDVAKVAPDAVRKLPGRDGKLAVNLGFPSMRKAFA